MKLTCRFCQKPLHHTFVDLGMSPVANDYIKAEREQAMEPFYPLHVFVCEHCYLVQLPEHRKENEVFTDEYAYFSSYSSSWVQHAKEYVEMMMKRFSFSSESLVVELASNDGYLLQFFKEHQVNVLGVEPCANVAEAAEAKGIPSLVEFFGKDTAEQMKKNSGQADLMIGNNVLAHVPDLNDFVAGVKVMLKPDGIFTFEFPHLMQLIELNQFDTIYHEHFSYFSFSVVQEVFAAAGLELFDVEQIPTHGGSLRIFGQHQNIAKQPISDHVGALLKVEREHGVFEYATYQQFSEKVKETKRAFLEFVIQAKREGKCIVGYGAPAKGNTFLNYCGVRTDFFDYTVDASPHKQDHFLPGVHIPIYPPAKLMETKPDYVVILPWNLAEEITKQHQYISEWGGKFVTAIPTVKIL